MWIRYRMGRFALASLVATALVGCGGAAGEQTQASPGTKKDVRAISKAEARSIAERKGREAGYDVNVYRVTQIELEEEGSFKGHWSVFFEHAPPAPVGGHFTVYVDERSGEAKLFHGR
jgi:hypothetical protein